MGNINNCNILLQMIYYLSGIETNDIDYLFNKTIDHFYQSNHIIHSSIIIQEFSFSLKKFS